MNESSQVPGHEASVSARRKLVRGVFAAPAALTLYSGSAFAANSMSCVARQVINPVSPAEFATTANNGGADTYFRVQLRGKFNGTPADLAHESLWVKGADLLAAAPTGNAGFFFGTSDWYCYSAGVSSGYLAGQVYLDSGTGSATDPSKGGTPEPIPKFVAIRFDTVGMVAGVTPATGRSAVSGSCWSSFKAAP